MPQISSTWLSCHYQLFGNPPNFTGDEQDDPFCDHRVIPVENADLLTGDNFVSYVLWN
jgi:hypothetical protein